MTVPKNQLAKAAVQASTSSVANGSKTIQALVAKRYGVDASLGTVLEQVTQELKALSEEPEKLKEVLATQSLVLDQVFQLCVETSLQQTNPKAFNAILNVGLRAQSASRQTLETLSQVSEQAPKTLPNKVHSPSAHSTIGNKKQA
ncbi:hypothetical protein [Pseudoalteromonas umbrosa]|uniref:hypothetical protein n=1 Tax=Pseudoalteromonas umbrosa TaxID=3048489 RepID=UPI0024C2CF81|nr:hypothetical protein [Pseudoalteromonas sp. B95]MDK1290147.1 hypothetical protein [Pseudoalteromonas sp. B95]